MKFPLKEKARYPKAERLLAMFEKLSLGESINKSQESHRFGIDNKTFQRDIEELRNYMAEFHPEETNTRIKYDRTKNAYILHRDEQIWLSSQEVLAVVKVLLESRAFPGQEMDSIISKLIFQSSTQERKYVEEAIRNERHHFMPLTHGKPLLKTIWDLSKACRESRLIEMVYNRIGDQKVVEYIVEPQGILFSEYYFYLMAYIHGTNYEYPAIYRLDKIIKYRILEEHYHNPSKERFEEGELRKRIQFMQSGKLMKIRFRFWGESLEAVLDRLPTAKIIGDDDKEVIVEAQVFGKSLLIRYYN